MAKDQPVPGGLDRVRDFVNTIDLESGADQLADGRTAAAWLTGHGFEAVSDDAGLARIRAFRESIRGVLLTNGGDGDPAAAWSRLMEATNGTPARIVLEKTGDVRLAAPPAADAEEALRAELAGLIYDAIRTGAWRRLKACRKDSCLWAFYDHSKNGSGAWCSMAVCGNRVKAQRRRSRQP